MQAERMHQPKTVTIRHAREMTCRSVKDFYAQGALAMKDIGLEHRQSRCSRTLKFENCHGEDDKTREQRTA
jgi:hypothetical protein